MRQRAAVALSITSLVVAVLAATPLGQAAGTRLAAAIPPFAKTAGFAKLSGNSSKLNNHRSTLRGLPGTIPVVGTDGKLPTSLGAIGPQGQAGQAGPAGPKGDRGPAGPTNGRATANGSPASYTNMADIGQPLEITVGSSGTLFVYGRIQAVVGCTAAQSCSRHFGLYLDDQPVEGTLVEVHAYNGETVTDNFAVFGTKQVNNGTHTVRFRAGNNPGVGSSLDVLANIGAIQLGG
jgi:hypothetical protein